MRTLLQDKRVVAVLALVALLAVGWRVRGYRHRFFPAAEAATFEPAPVSNPALPGPPPPAQAAAGSLDQGSQTQRSVLSNLTSWASMFPIRNLDRDPFGPLLAVPVSSPVPLVPLPADTSFVLQAISIEPNQAFAVINGQVVAVGDTVGEFVVEKISSTEVWLKHPGGRKVLQLEFARPAPVEVPDRTGPKSDANIPP